MTTQTAAEEWKKGWGLVLASFIGFLSFSVLIGSMSAFMGPLAKEFGWSRTLLSAGTGISSIVTALAGPFFGVLIDRFGSRKLALPGVVMGALVVMLMATNNGSGAYWIALWLIYAVTGLFINTPIWTAAVAGVFERSRGLALAIALAGATAAHAIMPPLSVWAIDTFGWRMAFVVLGLGWGVLAFVVCYFLFFDAHDRHRASQAAADSRQERPDFPGLTLAEAWRSWALWRIGISILVIMMLTIGFLVHQIEILIGTGVSREMAALLAGMAGAMGMVGKLVTGFLIDRYPGNWVGGLTMGSAAIAFYLLVGDVATPTLIVAAMLVNGYTAGAKLHIASYLTVQYSGMRNFGKIYGVISSLVAVGSGLGPIVAGAIYDALGDYEPFLLAGAVGLALSSFLLLTLPRYPDWNAREQALKPAAA